MQHEELKTKIASIVQTEDFQLLQGSTNKFSLRVDGKWFAFEESPETILWAIASPESYQSQQDAEIVELLADLI